MGSVLVSVKLGQVGTVCCGSSNVLAGVSLSMCHGGGGLLV